MRTDVGDAKHLRTYGEMGTAADNELPPEWRSSKIIDNGRNPHEEEQRSALEPYAARHIETHHHTIEWALANAIDTKKFNERIVRRMRLRPAHDPIYAGARVDRPSLVRV